MSWQTAFQENAFQNNAFQIAVGSSSSSSTKYYDPYEYVIPAEYKEEVKKIEEKLEVIQKIEISGKDKVRSIIMPFVSDEKAIELTLFPEMHYINFLNLIRNPIAKKKLERVLEEVVPENKWPSLLEVLALLLLINENL